MVVGGTTVGPLDPKIRDRLADYRDEHGFANYNETISALLDAHDD